MTPDRSNEALVDDELDVLAALVPLAGRDIVELGCGAAKLARALLERHPDSRVTGLEVDERQHAKNLAPRRRVCTSWRQVRRPSRLPTRASTWR